MEFTRSDLVVAYWRQYALSQGSRDERLAAADDFWAWEEVERAVDENDADLLELLDDLLRAPDADLGYFAAGPLVELLVEHPEHAAAVADRCRRNGSWSKALKGVWLSQVEQSRLEPLRPMLPPPVEAR